MHSEHYHYEMPSMPDYLHDQRVTGSMIQFLGGKGTNWHTAHIQHAYIGVEYLDRVRQGRNSPVSSIDPRYVGHMIDIHRDVGLHASLMPAERPDEDFPCRTLVTGDVDAFIRYPNSPDGHRVDNTTPLVRSWETFQALGPVIELYYELFDRLQIPVMVTMTGKGIHVLFQVHDRGKLEWIRQLGGPVEQVMQDRLNDPHTTKRHRAIPHAYQQIHVGSARLSQFINMLLIKEARRRLNPYGYRAEILSWAPPGEIVKGFAWDNAQAGFPVYNKGLSIPGSSNLAKAVKTGIYPYPHTVQIPISGNGFRIPLTEAMNIRNHWGRSAEYLGGIDCHIPVALNIDHLINWYLSSDLRRLHNAMDRDMGDPRERFNSTYRNNNYGGIVDLTRDRGFVRHVIDHAPSYFGKFINFWAMNKLVWEVFNGMGGSYDNLSPAPHVAGFLQALLEDPQKDWGQVWKGKIPPGLYARKMTEQFLGQMFAWEHPW